MQGVDCDMNALEKDIHSLTLKNKHSLLDCDPKKIV